MTSTFKGFVGASGQIMVDSIPTVGQIMRQYAPAYLAHVSPVMSQFLSDQHKMLEASLQHVEDRNTRALVAAMLLSATRAGVLFGGD